MRLFTVNLCLKDWPCLVVGGGIVAIPKAKRMIEAGARVTVIAPEIKEDLPGATLIRREARVEDLEGMRLAMFATSDRELNATLYQEALKRGILAAAVDDLDHCDFYMPAVMMRGDLEIAVSTSGTCPAYSVWVRDRLLEVVDDSYGVALSWFASLRERLRPIPMGRRGALYRALLSRDFLPRFRRAEVEAWAEEAEEVIAKQA
ncbi:bifunctional precorrin-2 dehydrogenase/sirohydrochlorin ferrochelatase [bacterium]|nr:bifunctional precorrin-2 dehydrogenase/sirohydrochlorin ferrochelatase [bacterium]